ncbi:iroquois-class homeodomain protein IRX-6 isoform X2 [Corvus cornix cornix]|uniref:iroquois-class homeodomain protein IRX-6 isoform X2 n=1 Tax=Corvus cornix cornix TaxID=932674 RepID=UPI00194DE0C2|nr:iroquois-class homeodomain protein IRX-6 isoform X2 [Corvus cornix cornix]
MSFSQFGYPYSTTSQFFVPASPSTTCCEAAPRSGPDASSAPAAASLCCAPYESRLLAPARAELNAALGMYSAPYAAGQGYGNYLPYGAEPAALYTALNPQYEIKEGAGTLHSGIAQPATYYSYDHSLGQYQYDRYGTVDFGGSARRKNATRETTSTLKTWLRRLKKENKMTWSPKNKAGEERKEETPREEDEYSAEREGREQKSYKEDKDLRFSDLEEEEEEEEEAGKPEKGRTTSLQEAPSLGAALPEAPRSECSLPGPFHAFPCAKAPAADFAPRLLGRPAATLRARGEAAHLVAGTHRRGPARRAGAAPRAAARREAAARRGSNPCPPRPSGAPRSTCSRSREAARPTAAWGSRASSRRRAKASAGRQGRPGRHRAGRDLPGQAADGVPARAAEVRTARPILGAGDGTPAVTKHSAGRNERNLSPRRRRPRGSVCSALAGKGRRGTTCCARGAEGHGGRSGRRTGATPPPACPHVQYPIDVFAKRKKKKKNKPTNPP